MEILRFTVRNQRLSGGKVRIVSDSIDYVEASFDFRTEDWSGLSKWAHFTKEDVTYDINLVDDKIAKDKHLNLGVGTWEVKLHGTDIDGSTRITTDSAYVTVESYGNAENENPLPEIPLTAAEQIDNKAQLAKENAAAALEKVLEAEAKMIAFEEAVKNGEFDGENGEPGKIPEIQIGNITTLPPDSDAEVTIEGTLEKPFLNFAIPQGKAGKDGVSISDITYEQSNEDGGHNMVSVYLTDGRMYGWFYSNGKKGSSGRPGLEWKGEWDPETSYWAVKDGQPSRDVVSYNGSSYVVAINSTAPVRGVVPEGDTTGKWALLAKKGDFAAGENTGNGLPEISADDNGKVLQVVDGEWKAEELSSEEAAASSVDFSGFESDGIIVERYPDGSAITYSFEFDENGNPVKITDSNGRETVLTW